MFLALNTGNCSHEGTAARHVIGLSLHALSPSYAQVVVVSPAMPASSDWQLKPHGVIPTGLPVLVCILDGWGENEVKDEFNATHAAATPHVDALRAGGPSRWRTVKAHGPAVGLPTWDDMGNSEVGHNALGAGQLIDQGARLVDRALAEGSLFQQDGWKYISAAFEAHTVHFIGLLSAGGVHSRSNQLHQRACPTRHHRGCAFPSRRALAHHGRGGCAVSEYVGLGHVGPVHFLMCVSCVTDSP